MDGSTSGATGHSLLYSLRIHSDIHEIHNGTRSHPRKDINLQETLNMRRWVVAFHISTVFVRHPQLNVIYPRGTCWRISGGWHSAQPTECKVKCVQQKHLIHEGGKKYCEDSSHGYQELVQYELRNKNLQFTCFHRPHVHNSQSPVFKDPEDASHFSFSSLPHMYLAGF